MKPKSKSPFKIGGPGALQASLLLLASCLSASAAVFTWDGGGADAVTSTAANWVGDVAPSSNNDLIFGPAAASGTALTYASGNQFSMTFASGAPAYTLTASAGFQFNNANAATVVNNSAFPQTFASETRVFFAGGKTFAGNTAPLNFPNVQFRADTMTAGQTSTLNLTGSAGGTISGSIATTGTGASSAVFDNLATGLRSVLAKAGSGIWTLNGNSPNFVGTTTITAGLLRVNGTNSSRGITISGGALGGTGTFTNSSAPVVVSGTGGIDLVNGSVGTLTFPNTLAITGALGANNLRFDLGAGSAGTDKLVVGADTSVTTPGAAVISFNQIGGAATRIDAGTYDLIQGSTSMADAAQFALATSKAFGSTFALGVVGTSLQLTTTQAAPGPATAFWAGGSDAWSTASNWNTDAAGAVSTGEAPGYQTNVTFGTTTPAAANLTSNLVDSDFDINSLSFNSLVGNTTIGGTGMLTLEANGGNGITASNTSGTNIISARIGLAANQTWSTATPTVAGTNLLTVSGAITDFGAGFSLTKTGTGRITLSGANRISGPLVVSAGSLYINRSLATGANTLNIGSSATVATGATLVLAGVGSTTTTVDAPISLTGSSTVVALEFPTGNTQTYAVNSPISITNGAAIRSFGLNNIYTYSSPITGNATTTGLLFRTEGGNSVNQPHTLNLNAASTYTGNTTFSAVSQQAIVRVGVNDALPATTSLTLIGGGNANSSSALDLNGRTQTLAGLVVTPNAGGARVINISGTPGTLAINNPTDSTIAGVIGVNSTAAIANNNGFNFIKAGPSVLTLSAANLYSGTTTVSGGTLRIGNANSLGSAGSQIFGTNRANGLTTVAAGAVLDLNGVTNVNESITLNGTGISSNGALINSSATAASLGNGIQSLALTTAIPALGLGSGFSNNTGVAIIGTGTGATARATYGLTTASITGITAGGTGYAVDNLVNITGGGGTGAIAKVTSVSEVGAITSLEITVAGTGYTTAPTGMTRNTGTGSTTPAMTLTGNATNFTVTGVAIATAGTGYTGTPILTIGGVEQAATFTLASRSLTLASNSSIGGTGNITIDPPVTGAFDLTKVGANTLTLNGATSYTGATTVLNGTLSLASPALSDTAALTIGDVESSTAVLNLPNAGTDTVGSLIIDGVTRPNGLYDSTNSGGAITGLGKIQVGTSTDPYLTWTASFGLQNPWLGSDPALNGNPSADPDNDGIANVLEFVLGGSPLTASQALLPTAAVVGNDLVLSYKRSDESEAPATTQVGQWSTDLITWTSVTPVLVNENAALADDMTVSVPTSNAVGGKLFIRLNVVTP